jgi:ketosteroid isomerase-like protein
VAVLAIPPRKRGFRLARAGSQAYGDRVSAHENEAGLEVVPATADGILRWALTAPPPPPLDDVAEHIRSLWDRGILGEADLAAVTRGYPELGVRVAFAALNAGDLDAYVALVAEDVEFTSLVAEAEGTTFRGHQGVRDWWRTVRAAFQDVRWELLDFRDYGDRAVTKLHIAGTLGGVHVEQTMWQLVTHRDGRARSWRFFRTEQEAEAAAKETL